MADIALVVVTVPRIRCRLGLSWAPFKQIFGDEAIAVPLSKKAVNIFSVEAWSRLAITSIRTLSVGSGGGSEGVLEYISRL